MKQLFLILIIALATCNVVRVSFDGNIVPSKVATKVTRQTNPRKTSNDVKNAPMKGNNPLFTRKQGEAFRKLPQAIQNAIEWFKKNNLWEDLVHRFKNPGENYDEYCEKFFPEEVCKETKDFISDNF